MYENGYTLLIFLVVYTLITVRRIKSIVIPPWLAMLIGTLAVLIPQIVSIEEAYTAIKSDVILFLLGMLIVVSALEVSGLLHDITLRILKYANSTDRLILFILVVMGTLSAFLMNDTIALVATPIILSIAKIGIDPKPLLITLAFAVTIGSTMTSIGNPQNFLIAVESNMRAPMLEFLKYLALPTIANWIATYYIVRLYFRKMLKCSIKIDDLKPIAVDDRLAKISKVTVVLIFLTFFIVIVLGYDMYLRISHIAIIGAIAILALAKGYRLRILRNVNYGIIVLFIAMFVFMHALDKVGLINSIASIMRPDSIFSIVISSVILSQLMGNVPFVAFYTKVMHANGLNESSVKEWVALAGASTLAGNLTILGAASNLIILEAARGKDTFTLLGFFKVGSIVTCANIVILLLFLLIIP